jgi:hypothetical protein
VTDNGADTAPLREIGEMMFADGCRESRAGKNPKGISSFSPALTHSGYAGWRIKMASTLKGLNRCARNGDATPLGLKIILAG